VDRGATWQRTELGANVSIIDLAACPDGSLLALDFNRRVWSAGPDARAWKAHPLALPRTPLVLLLAFVLFRVFDIVKPPPARQAQALPGGFGVLVDDLVAGLYALVVVAALRTLFGWP